MSTSPAEHTTDQADAMFPRGDWFGAGRWRETPLYARTPTVMERAMRALADLAHPAWFRDQVRKAPGERRHPLAIALLDTSYMGMWGAISTGLHLASAGQVPDSVRHRLLDPAEFTGAASELGAAACLRAHGLTFDWHPPEGGEFAVHDDSIRYVEVKRPQYTSERADTEMKRLTELWMSVSRAFPGYVVSFHLRPDLLDGLSARQRSAFDWRQLEHLLVGELDSLRRADDVPGRRDLPIGTIWLARSQPELRQLGGGGYGGFYLDERYEHDRVIRNAINGAIRQLPAGEPSLLVLDWGAATAGLAMRSRNVSADSVTPSPLWWA